MRPASLERLARETSGSVAVPLAATCIVLVGATGLGVDVYRIQNTQAGLIRVADSTCSIISRASPVFYTTANDVVAMASRFARAELDANAATKGAIVSVARSGSDYRISLEKRVPATLSSVVGYRGVNAQASSDCPTNRPNPSSCQANSFLLKVFYSKNYRLSVSALSNASPPQARTSHFVVTLARLVSDRTVVDTRFVISNDYVIYDTAPKVSADTNIFVQNINADGTMPDFCETASPPPAPPPPICTGSSCPPKTPRSCDPVSIIGNNNRSNRNLTMNAKEYASAVSMSRGEGALTLSGFPTTDSDALPSSPWTFPLGAKFTASVTTVTVTNRAKVVFDSVPLEQAYLYKVASGSFPQATAYVKAGYKLVYVKSTSDAVWEDAQGNCLDLTSPLALDLVGLGEIRTTGEATAFDAIRSKVGRTITIPSKDGPLAIEWLVGNGQGFLIDNRDGAAASDMRFERLFGPDGETANGFETLRMWDRSGTGVISGSDLEGLAVWIDDGDGIAQPAEIRSVQDLGITALSTRWSNIPGPNGTRMQSFAIRNGRMILMEDIWLSNGRTEGQVALQASAP